MPPKEKIVVTPDDNIKLLLSIIKSTGAKPDWKLVAADCNIVSSAAANKRFERLCKAQGTTAGATTSGSTTSKNDVKAAGSSPAGDDCDTGDTAKAQSKKRKGQDDENDGEGGKGQGTGARGKGGGGGAKGAKKVKVEDQSDGDEDEDGAEAAAAVGA